MFFFEILKVSYQQYLVPHRPTVGWFGDWLFREDIAKSLDTHAPAQSGLLRRGTDGQLPEGTVRQISQAFIDRLFPSAPSPERVDYYKPVQPSAWSQIAQRVEDYAVHKPTLSEILIATAHGQCDGELGSPRLGLIEAVVALEIEVKKLMHDSLARYGLSKSMIDKIVRSTPLADLVAVWILREMPEEDWQDNTLHRRCAEAVHERNLLLHRERRGISVERARQHIRTIAELVDKARRKRESMAVQEEP